MTDVYTSLYHGFAGSALTFFLRFETTSASISGLFRTTLAVNVGFLKIST
jgi:hypothetical protein